MGEMTGDGTSALTIRLYRETDRDAMFDICMRTGWAGGDARGYFEDQELLPDIFAAPFAALEPDLLFMLDNGERAVGYVAGTSDTVRFVKEYRERWLPLVADRHIRPTSEPSSHDEVMANLLHNPESMIIPDLADYPAHLHIDILPEYQGMGYGQGLMRAELAALHKAGAPRVFLGMLTVNTAARVFYEKVGFHVVPVANSGPLTYLGRSTAEPL
jgi:ribosomal protein S18 acetylase RimI-like enzyme